MQQHCNPRILDAAPWGIADHFLARRHEGERASKLREGRLPSVLQARRSKEVRP